MMMTDPTPDVRHPIERQRAAATIPTGEPVIVGGVTLQELPDGRIQIISPLAGLVRTTWEHFLANLSAEHAAAARAVVEASVEPQEQLAAHAEQLEQPAWAESRYYAPDRGNEGAVVYQWAARVPAGLTNNTDADGFPLEVTLQQHRLLTLTPTGVEVEDEPVTVHCDAGDLWVSPDDARALAAALVACADRADGAASGDDQPI